MAPKKLKACSSKALNNVEKVPSAMSIDNTDAVQRAAHAASIPGKTQNYFGILLDISKGKPVKDVFAGHLTNWFIDVVGIKTSSYHTITSMDAIHENI